MPPARQTEESFPPWLGRICTITVVVAIGACVPLLFGKETIGQLEIITEAIPKPRKL